jgi:hypothetical protein
MTLVFHQSSQPAKVTQRAVTGGGPTRGCTINVNQVVSKERTENTGAICAIRLLLVTNI